MFKNNVMKKFVIIIASLALILPLASAGSYSASANVKTNHKQTVRVVKKHAHHYYKFAYNKKEYEKYLKQVHVYKKGVEKINAKFRTNKKSVAYRKGFNDALYNVWTNKLANNKQYRDGYTVANAYSIFGNTNKSAMKHSQESYNETKKEGATATGSAVNQWKMEAHLNTL